MKGGGSGGLFFYNKKMIDLFLKVKTSTFLSYLSLYGPVPLSGVAPTQVEQMQLAAKMAELRTAQQRAMELPRTPLSHPLTPTNIPPPPPRPWHGLSMPHTPCQPHFPPILACEGRGGGTVLAFFKAWIQADELYPGLFPLS